jgi:hypothetical protein
VDAPNRDAYPGLESLAIHLAARRQLLFDGFIALWTEQGRLGVWDRLEREAKRTLQKA